MHFASPSATADRPEAHRALSVGLVAGLHVAVIWAFAQGLMPRLPWQAAPEPITARVARPDAPPPPQPRPPSTDPVLQRPVIEVYVPPVVVDPTPTATSITATTTQPPDGPLTPTARQPDAVLGTATGERASPQRQSASMLCPVMASPEPPASGWEGVAQFTVQGTVQGGRVVAVEVLSRSGVADRRAQRALGAAIDTALRHYRCNSDGVFVQEFVFRPE